MKQQQQQAQAPHNPKIARSSKNWSRAEKDPKGKTIGNLVPTNSDVVKTLGLPLCRLKLFFVSWHSYIWQKFTVYSMSIGGCSACHCASLASSTPLFIVLCSGGFGLKLLQALALSTHHLEHVSLGKVSFWTFGGQSSVPTPNDAPSFSKILCRESVAWEGKVRGAWVVNQVGAACLQENVGQNALRPRNPPFKPHPTSQLNPPGQEMEEVKVYSAMPAWPDRTCVANLWVQEIGRCDTIISLNTSAGVVFFQLRSQVSSPQTRATIVLLLPQVSPIRNPILLEAALPFLKSPLSIVAASISCQCHQSLGIFVLDWPIILAH